MKFGGEDEHVRFTIVCPKEGKNIIVGYKETLKFASVSTLKFEGEITNVL